MLRIAILYTSRWPLCCADPVELCELSSSLIVQSPRDCSRSLHVPDTVHGAGVRLCVMFSTAVVPLSPSPSLRHYLLTHSLIFRLYSPSQSASMIPTSTVTIGKHLFALRRRSLYIRRLVRTVALSKLRRANHPRFKWSTTSNKVSFRFGKHGLNVQVIDIIATTQPTYRYFWEATRQMSLACRA